MKLRDWRHTNDLIHILADLFNPISCLLDIQQRFLCQDLQKRCFLIPALDALRAMRHSVLGCMIE